MKVIIIPCSGQKLSRGRAYYPEPRLLETLGEAAFGQLLAARRELSELIGLSPGPDLGGSDPSEGIEYRPAFERYSGIMYRRAEFRRLFPDFWGRVLIISALYGLLDAGDHIRYYDLAMDNRLSSGERVWRWWRKKDLPEFVAASLSNLRGTIVHDLLIGCYRRATGSIAMAGHFSIKTYNYAGLGYGALYRRGDDLRALLQKAGEA